MDYQLIINIASIILGASIALAILLDIPMLMYIFYAATHKTHFEDTDQKFKYAVIVPARDESKVIRHVLDSLKAQTYPTEYFDVYVIVERKDDPTVEIVKEYGYNILFRTNLENRRRKGYALEEAYEQIKTLNRDYDSLIIFDADNFIDKNFIVELNKVRATGAEMGLGYRKSTNSTKSWISGCSTLLFSIMYSLMSKGQAHYVKKVMICGTGYYVRTKIVDDAGGWIWHTLTEDAEITKYAASKNIICDYNEEAIMYDEQPTKYKQMNDQHMRWILGYAQSSGKYKVEKKRPDVSRKQHIYNRYIHTVGIIPIIIGVVVPLVYAVLCFVFMGITFVKNDEIWKSFLAGAIVGSLFLSFAFLVVTTFDLISDRKRLNFPFWFSVKVAFTFIIFFIDFIPAFFRGIFSKKNREWKVIEHSGEVTTKDINVEDK